MKMEQQDKIGREDIVNKICSLVDNLKPDANFCLALNGEWGSGKTFVMQMLEQKFCEHPEYIVIKYDAWKNNFYSDPLIAILYCLLDGIKEYVYLLPEIQEKMKKGMKKNLQTWGNGAIKALKASKGIVAVLGCAIEGIKNIVTATGKLTNHEKFADFCSYQSLLEEVKKKLNAVTEFKNYENRQTKLVVLVDEIDRCLPNEQLIVLERLHHLFNVKNCAVVIAMNRNQIISVFNSRFGANGKEYLRKFFDYNFFIQAESIVYFKNYILDNIVANEYFTFIQIIKKEQIEFLQEYIFSILRNEYGDILKIDDKTISRILNIISDIAVNIPDKKLDFPFLFLISVSVCLKLYWKDRYKEVFNKYAQKQFYFDFFKDYKSNLDMLIIIDSYVLINSRYNIYKDYSLNTINYYMNMWYAKGNNRLEEGIKRIFSSKILAEPNFQKALDYIFSKVDIITD